MKSKILWKITASFLLCSNLNAFEVTHQVRPNSTYESASLNSSCSTLAGVDFASRCNPALFPFTKEQNVSIALMGKADGDSIDNGRDLIFDPISEDLIRKLFEEKNFNSVTLNSDITFKTSLFEISYSPYYLIADLFIFNPAFPEISIHLVNRETFQLTKGWDLGVYEFMGIDFQTSLGGNVYYYEHSSVNTVFSLFDLSILKPEELIQFKSTYGVSGDLGYYLGNSTSYIPDISLQIKNIESKVRENDNNVNSSIYQSPKFLFETYSLMGFGKRYKTIYGDFSINYEVPFGGYFQEIATRHSMLGARYSLKLFSIFLSAGENYQNIGMRFNSKMFNVGITYAREADMGDLQEDVENSVYTGIEFNL
jgi:hypothetical protein